MKEQISITQIKDFLSHYTEKKTGHKFIPKTNDRQRLLFMAKINHKSRKEFEKYLVTINKVEVS